MSRDPCILGWAQSGAVCPPGISFVPLDGTDILLIQDTCAPDARNRLQSQVRCFDYGVDFLPTMPAAAVSPSEASGFAATHALELAGLLCDLSGTGQVTLSMGTEPLPAPPKNAPTGRDWMQQRHARHKQLTARNAIAIDVFDQLGTQNFVTKTRTTGFQTERDVLVPRDCFIPFLNDLQAKARSISSAPAPLAVTGLWPPFSFVQPIWDKRPVWD